MQFQDIHAFDYHPSISTMLIDHWRREEESVIWNELCKEKERRPEANAVRFTHSYDAYLRDRERYMERFERLLEMAQKLEWGVICCLFNRYHDKQEDCGGLYLEYLIPGSSWSYKEGFYAQFLWDICGKHAHDGRIILWESCNKPYSAYRDFSQEQIANHLYERRWLREVYCYIRKTETKHPVAISVQDWFGSQEIAEMEHCCDVLLRSPYYVNDERTRAIMNADLSTAKKPVVTIEL